MAVAFERFVAEVAEAVPDGEDLALRVEYALDGAFRVKVMTARTKRPIAA